MFVQIHDPNKCVVEITFIFNRSLCCISEVLKLATDYL